MMRFAAVFVMLVGCKAGELGNDPNGMTKPVETPLPLVGEGAASPTSAPDTPTAATEEEDPWTATSDDPWIDARVADEVTVSPMFDDPWLATSADPWAPTAERTKPQPLR